MLRNSITIISLASVLALSGCVSLQPEVPEADARTRQEWPLPETAWPAETGPDGIDLSGISDIGWRDFFIDPKLEELIGLALDNNHDLRQAALNVQRARALYGIQRAARFPSLHGSGDLNRRGGEGQTEVETYSAELGLASYEIDLFGRVKSLSDAALNQYLATEQAQASVQLSLISEVAGSYMTLAADLELRELARSTLALYEEELALTRRRYELGAVSSLDVNQSRTIVANAKADIALYEGQVAQDISALNLLVGTIVEADQLPDSFSQSTRRLDPLPAGIPSEVLLRRPDIRQAELQLLAANANIGAARAAFFPSVSLTGTWGSASADLDNLFTGGTGVWSFRPTVSIPIFQGGRLRANRDVAYADRDIALAGYEQSIQRGFKEVSDALTLRWTLSERRGALEELVSAAEDTRALSEERYQAGQDSYLVLLDAQRTLYGARQALLQSQLNEQVNLINLYKVLGGGWKDQS